MATEIFSSTDDGHIYMIGTNWAIVRNATTGSFSGDATTSYAFAIRATATSGRGSTNYNVTRSFFKFDTSSITHVPKEGSLMIYGSGNTNADVRVVKSNASFSLSTSDFDSIVGWQSGVDNQGNVIYYDTAETSTWSSSSYNVITLSQQALVDIAGNSEFQCCLIENDYDLRYSTPSSSSNYSGITFADYSGTSRDPKLSFTEQENAVFFGTNF